MVKTSTVIITIIIIILLIGLGVGAFFLIQGLISPAFIETNLYNVNGDLISSTAQSVVNSVEGVAFVSFAVNVENLDTVPLTLSVDSISPLSVDSAKPTESISVEPGVTGSMLTDLIDIQPFEGTNQEFCITVISEAIPALREESSKTGCTSLDVSANPLGQFNVVIDPNLDEPNIDPSCVESWTCSNWGACVTETETRTCTDSNACGTTDNKPDETRACVSSNANFRTAVDNYKFNSVACGGGSGNMWMAYSDVCGQQLTGYGFVEEGEDAIDDCDSRMAENEATFIADVPYNPSGSCRINPNGNGVAKLYKLGDPTFGEDLMIVCETDADGIGFWTEEFDANDPDANDADTSFVSVDSMRELSC